MRAKPRVDDVESELLQIASEVERATGVEELRPLFYRLNKLGRQNLGNSDVQSIVSKIQTRVIQRGNLLCSESLSPLSPKRRDEFRPPPDEEAPGPDLLSMIRAQPTTPLHRPIIDVEVEDVPEETKPERPARRRSLFYPGPGKRGQALTVVAGTLMGMSMVVGLVRIVRTEAPVLLPSNVVHIQSDPPGARIEVDGEPEGIGDAQIQLASGDHKVVATLDGYEPATTLIRVGEGQPETIRLHLTPGLLNLHIHTDLAAGHVLLDGKLAGELDHGELNLRDLPQGKYEVSVISGEHQADFWFESKPGSPPEWTAPVKTASMFGLLLGSTGARGRAISSATSGTILLDDLAAGELAPLGAALAGVTPGDHEIAFVTGSSHRRFQVPIANGPTLHAYLMSDAKSGGITVLTGEDEADVLINGRVRDRRTSGGRLRITGLAPGDYLVLTRKPGFKPIPEQFVTVRAGEESRVQFDLKPLPDR